MSNLTEKELREIADWQNYDANNPIDELEHLMETFLRARHLFRKTSDYNDIFKSSKTILEIGAGSGWASCFIKKLFSDKTVIASDISEHALNLSKKWESILGVTLDKLLICKSYNIELEDNSTDLVFAFHAAHHFVHHKETLKEIHRILKPGGICLYLQEPSCRQFLYKLAVQRANSKRPGTEIEDLLIYKKILKMAQDVGFDSAIKFDNCHHNREFMAQNYYFILGKMPFLNHIIPSAADYIFKKPFKD